MVRYNTVLLQQTIRLQERTGHNPVQALAQLVEEVDDTCTTCRKIAGQSPQLGVGNVILGKPNDDVASQNNIARFPDDHVDALTVLLGGTPCLLIAPSVDYFGLA